MLTLIGHGSIASGTNQVDIYLVSLEKNATGCHASETTLAVTKSDASVSIQVSLSGSKWASHGIGALSKVSLSKPVERRLTGFCPGEGLVSHLSGSR